MKKEAVSNLEQSTGLFPIRSETGAPHSRKRGNDWNDCATNGRRKMWQTDDLRNGDYHVEENTALATGGHEILSSGEEELGGMS